MWPIVNFLHMTVFDRVPMDVINMTVEIVAVTDSVFPKPSLSNAALVFSATWARIGDPR